MVVRLQNFNPWSRWSLKVSVLLPRFKHSDIHEKQYTTIIWMKKWLRLRRNTSQETISLLLTLSMRCYERIPATMRHEDMHSLNALSALATSKRVTPISIYQGNQQLPSTILKISEASVKARYSVAEDLAR